ncbi:Mlp family lipoprotein [Borreliella lusitaniae]|uniref:Mlp family lipoprotein n=1 Tax=Borreliella lusitaniae TaxID=100177 RepID=A0ABZ0CJF5_9SPIR|nr:Mlp family lipoprotein [Borreliella lusitaniae]WNY69142.1 Mlp family lipoprotein [Borreliella lusitaniae]
MKRINILKISVLLTLLIILMFSCKQYGVKQFAEEINDSPGVQNSNVSKNKNSESSQTVKAVIAKSWPSLTPEEAEKLQTATSFLGEAITANGREAEKAEYEKSYKEFFDWLSKDINKQKEFLQALDKVYGIIVKAVEKDKAKYRNGEGVGLNEYISSRIKEDTGGYLSLFFQKVADAFGSENYKIKGKNNQDNNQKPEKSNEEIFKFIKKVFTESGDNNELKTLKDYADGNIG